MDERLNLTQNWFKKADNDLKNAKAVIEVEEPPTDTICFHCQQTAEKYLKGFLAYHNIEFEKEHDLDYLLDLCCQMDSSFDSLRDMAGWFTFEQFPMIFWKLEIGNLGEKLEI